MSHVGGVSCGRSALCKKKPSLKHTEIVCWEGELSRDPGPDSPKDKSGPGTRVPLPVRRRDPGPAPDRHRDPGPGTDRQRQVDRQVAGNRAPRKLGRARKAQEARLPPGRPRAQWPRRRARRGRGCWKVFGTALPRRLRRPHLHRLQRARCREAASSQR